VRAISYYGGLRLQTPLVNSPNLKSWMCPWKSNTYYSDL